MRRSGLKARLVEISYRDSSMIGRARQHKMEFATDVSRDIAQQAYELFCKCNPRSFSIRSIGVRAGELVPSWFPEQTNLFSDPITNQKRSDVEHSVDALRRRFGYFSVQRAVLMAADPRLIIDAAGQHTVHPHSFM